MARFEVKVSQKSNKKRNKTYRPVAADKAEAYQWGEKQAAELYAEGAVEVVGEVTE